MTGRKAIGLAALAGAALALTQQPLGFWWVMFLSGPVIWLLWFSAHDAPRPGRAAFLTGWAAGSGFFALSLHWIVEPFLIDIARHGWMAPFALFLMSAGLALFWGGGFWLAWRVRRFASGPFILAIGWALGEFARSYVLTGFPWALPAYAWTNTPLAQAAALIGPYGLSLLTLAAMLSIGPLITRPRAPLAAILVLPVFAGLWVWGAARIPHEAPTEGRPVIRILQTDVDQREKWSEENRRTGFEKLLALSTTPAETRPALVLWPENAVTFPIDMAAGARDLVQASLGETALALGSLRLDAGPEAEIRSGARWRNSLFLLDRTGLSRPFDKVHLVPFGEYLPLEGFFASIGLSSLAGVGGGIVAGDEHVLMQTGDLPPFAPLICYEMIFPRETARAADGAKWLALVTNDGWFGDWAGPAQHLGIARMRAIETGLPVARAANRGHSAMISPYGQVTLLSQEKQEGVIDAALPDSISPTAYFRYGELFTLVLLTFCLIAAILRGQIRTRPSDC